MTRSENPKSFCAMSFEKKNVCVWSNVESVCQVWEIFSGELCRKKIVVCSRHSLSRRGESVPVQSFVVRHSVIFHGHFFLNPLFHADIEPFSFVCPVEKSCETCHPFRLAKFPVLVEGRCQRPRRYDRRSDRARRGVESVVLGKLAFQLQRVEKLFVELCVSVQARQGGLVGVKVCIKCAVGKIKFSVSVNFWNVELKVRGSRGNVNSMGNVNFLQSGSGWQIHSQCFSIIWERG